MEKKTALMQAIEKCKSAKDNFNSPVNEKLDDIIIEIKSLLPVEREQHKDTRRNGFTNGVTFERHNYEIQPFDEYFNNTYTQE